MIWVIRNNFSRAKTSSPRKSPHHRRLRGGATGMPWAGRELPAQELLPGQGEAQPPLGRSRTHQVALLLPHAGRADHVILLPSPVSESPEEVVRQKPVDGVSDDVDVDRLVSSKPNKHTNMEPVTARHFWRERNRGDRLRLPLGQHARIRPSAKVPGSSAIGRHFIIGQKEPVRDLWRGCWACS